jgi:tRNA(Ile)-lysidine synthase
MLQTGDAVLVAISGGPDSVGLLAILNELRDRLGIGLIAAHVNHNLRGDDSLADERCACAVAERLAVPFVRADLPASLARGGNQEARARELRYEALHDLAARTGCTKIATGHTLDDQAETVLLRLLRGAGPFGLGAIRPLRADGVIRPLIECSRTAVLEVVQRLGLGHRRDASNDDPRFQRAVIRHRVLPLLRDLNPGIHRALGAVADGLRAVETIVKCRTDGELAALCENGRLVVGRLAGVSPGLCELLVHQWLIEQGAVRLTARHVDAVLRLASSGSGSGSVSLPGALVVRRVYGEIIIEPLRREREEHAGAELVPGRSLRLPGGWVLRADQVTIASGDPLPRDLWSAHCDFEVEAQLRIRTRRRGDRVHPLGFEGSRKLSDLFIDRKVPVDERADYPVVEADGEILWVPGVVRGRGHLVSRGTSRVLRLSAERQPLAPCAPHGSGLAAELRPAGQMRKAAVAARKTAC